MRSYDTRVTLDTRVINTELTRLQWPPQAHNGKYLLLDSADSKPFDDTDHYAHYDK